MPIRDHFSNREFKAPDVWTYDTPSDRLRVQVWNIVQSAMGSEVWHNKYDPETIYHGVHDAVAHEHGVELLASTSTAAASYRIERCIKSTPDINIWLDVVELIFRYIGAALLPLSEAVR